MRNTQVDGTVVTDVPAGGATTLADVGIGTTKGCVISPGIDTPNDRGSYTATRVKILGHDDGFRAGGAHITIRDSYVRNCGQSNSHGDGVRDFPAAQHLVLDHTTMDLCGTWTSVPDLVGSVQRDRPQQPDLPALRPATR